MDSLFIEDSTYLVPADRDLSNLRLWATGPYAARLGAEPEQQRRATTACALDMGYTILPNSNLGDIVIQVDKSANPTLLGLTAGESTTFTLKVKSGRLQRRWRGG